jgi:hypothetical protein
MEQRLSWEADRFSASQDIPRNFMEAEGSSPHSQEPATCLYLKPDRSSPCPPPPVPSSSWSVFTENTLHAVNHPLIPWNVTSWLHILQILYVNLFLCLIRVTENRPNFLFYLKSVFQAKSDAILYALRPIKIRIHILHISKRRNADWKHIKLLHYCAISVCVPLLRSSRNCVRP